MENERRALPLKARRSKTKRAGLTMSVTQIERNLRESRYVQRTRTTGAVYMTAVLEYLCAEVLDLAGRVATVDRRYRITPRHIMMAIQDDAELKELLKDVHIRQAGVKPFVNSALLKKKPFLPNEPDDRLSDELSNLQINPAPQNK